MYRTEVITKEQAVAHLFFHCCFRDELATQAETASIADKLVALQLHKDLDLKEEVRKYKIYQPQIESEEDYIQYLASLLPVENTIALYSYCVELCLTDLVLQESEEKLLLLIAHVFGVRDIERPIINKVMLQRKLVEAGKLF